MDEQKLVIEGTEYNIADLTEDQKYMVSQVNDLRAKINQLRFNLDQLMIAEQHFVKMVTESVKEQGDAEEGDQE